MVVNIPQDKAPPHDETSKTNGESRPAPAAKKKESANPDRPIAAKDNAPTGHIGKWRSRFDLLFTALMTVATCCLAWLAWDASATSQKQVRAYVIPSVQLKGNTIYVTVSNNGQTPALMCCVSVKNVTTSTGAANEPPQYAREGKPIVIAAGRQVVVTHEIRPLKKKEVLTPSVRIEYDDVFKAHHESTFEFEQDAWHPSELTMLGYNTSDLGRPLASYFVAIYGTR